MTLNVGGIERKIRTDFRDCMTILDACSDPDLTHYDKLDVILTILYEDDIEDEYVEEALQKAIWFMNCGNTIEERQGKRVYDWEQDEQMIFSAVNKVAGKELRMEPYVHFRTFISYFHEIGEGLFSTVTHIRSKMNKNKELEKHEQEFYRENKALVDLKKRYSAEQQAEIDFINSLLG